MDTGLTIRPATGATQLGVVRDEASPLPKAEPTELAPSKAVVAADAGGKTEALPGSPQRRGDDTASHAPPSYDTGLETQVIIDSQSREVIFRMVDVHSKRVVDQIPDHALLRLRAYSRAIQNGESVIAAMARTDLAT